MQKCESPLERMSHSLAQSRTHLPPPQCTRYLFTGYLCSRGQRAFTCFSSHREEAGRNRTCAHDSNSRPRRAKCHRTLQGVPGTSKAPSADMLGQRHAAAWWGERGKLKPQMSTYIRGPLEILPASLELSWLYWPEGTLPCAQESLKLPCTGTMWQAVPSTCNGPPLLPSLLFGLVPSAHA